MLPRAMGLSGGSSGVSQQDRVLKCLKREAAWLERFNSGVSRLWCVALWAKNGFTFFRGYKKNNRQQRSVACKAWDICYQALCKKVLTSGFIWQHRAAQGPLGRKGENVKASLLLQHLRPNPPSPDLVSPPPRWQGGVAVLVEGCRLKLSHSWS